MSRSHQLTAHAKQRSGEREIPAMIAELIVDFGHSRDAGNGTCKFALTRDSMREIRRFAGRSIANAIEPYRRRNAYVVAAGDRIVTVAFAARPLFN